MAAPPRDLVCTGCASRFSEHTPRPAEKAECKSTLALVCPTTESDAKLQWKFRDRRTARQPGGRLPSWAWSSARRRAGPAGFRRWRARAQASSSKPPCPAAVRSSGAPLLITGKRFFINHSKSPSSPEDKCVESSKHWKLRRVAEQCLKS